jgi:hypothetical protein
VRGVVTGNQFGPFPHPAALLAPAAYRVRRHRKAVFGLERRYECCPTPAGAAQALGPRDRFEYDPKGAHAPRHHDPRLGSARAPPRWGSMDAEAPRAIHSHDPVHAGAGAQQESRNLRRVSAHSTAQEDMQRQKIAVSCAAE